MISLRHSIELENSTHTQTILLCPNSMSSKHNRACSIFSACMQSIFETCPAIGYQMPVLTFTLAGCPHPKPPSWSQTRPLYATTEGNTGKRRRMDEVE
ncbi:hypothetical protein P167DRAFT_433844 [Morchella conica CCBAS932]|uniref:Uncharacterized protein n=1 Tax=Morchella conica CCBAS932 TaxID=1392247 RepID=A0A3N4KYA3_9PEZI|nr:hypothetical protein P167DRAFT_433844 [Morchella conica CCBAS932]